MYITKTIRQYNDKQAQDIIYSILPESVEGIELLDNTDEKLNKLETLCIKLNSDTKGKIPEYDTSKFAIQFAKQNISQIQQTFSQNLEIVTEMEDKLSKNNNSK